MINEDFFDEGYVKFDCHWEKTLPLAEELVHQLNLARSQMYDLGVIGMYDNGIGFGNISQRLKGNEFLISGTATGQILRLDASHYSWVTDYDIDSNQVWCKGAASASSETMSHAVVYETCPAINVVIHIHHFEVWKKVLHQIPTTREDVAYGTPAMAKEIIRLLETSDELRKDRSLAMAGHREGLIVFGENRAEAVRRVIELLG